MIYPKLSDGTIDWCVMCKHEGSAVYDLCCECEYPENPDDPPTKYEPKPITNADRIRAMTDEELAEFINDVWDRLLFGNDLPGMCDVCYTDTIQNCKKCWLDWLRQETDK